MNVSEHRMQTGSRACMPTKRSLSFVLVWIESSTHMNSDAFGAGGGASQPGSRSPPEVRGARVFERRATAEVIRVGKESQQHRHQQHNNNIIITIILLAILPLILASNLNCVWHREEAIYLEHCTVPEVNQLPPDCTPTLHRNRPKILGRARPQARGVLSPREVSSDFVL